MELVKSRIREQIERELLKNNKICEKKDFVFKNDIDFWNYIDFFYNLSEHKQRYLNSINNFVHNLKYNNSILISRSSERDTSLLVKSTSVVYIIFFKRDGGSSIPLPSPYKYSILYNCN